MDESKILKLLQAIDTVDFREFWWGSKLLEKCRKAKDPRVAIALTTRHHCLGNKKADSAHVIRNAIKEVEGTEFKTLWKLIDGVKNHSDLVSDIDNPYSKPWGAAYIIGEMGGAGALEETCARLTTRHDPRYYLLTRLATHLLVRYSRIRYQGEPTITIKDVKTGKSSKVRTREFDLELYERQMLRRKQEDEYFVPVEMKLMEKLNRRMSRLPQRVVPGTMSEIRKLMSNVPVITGEETSRLVNKEGLMTGGVTKFKDGKHLFHATDNADVQTMVISTFIMFASDISKPDQIIFSRWAGMSEEEWTQDHRETFALVLYHYLQEESGKEKDLPPEVRNAANLLLEKGAVPPVTKELSTTVKNIFKRLFVL